MRSFDEVLAVLGLAGVVIVAVFLVALVVTSVLLPLFVWRIAVHTKQTQRQLRSLNASIVGLASRRSP